MKSRRTPDLHAEKNDTKKKKTLWTKNCSLICQKLRKNIINLILFSLAAVIGISKLAWRANVPGNHSSISASSALSGPRWRGCHSPAYRLSGACSLSNPKEGVSHRATPWLLLANSGHLLRPPASEGQRSNKSSQAQRGWVGLGLGMGGRGGGGGAVGHAGKELWSLEITATCFRLKSKFPNQCFNLRLVHSYVNRLI